MQIVYDEVRDETAQLHLVLKDSQILEDSIKDGNYPCFSHADDLATNSPSSPSNFGLIYTSN